MFSVRRLLPLSRAIDRGLEALLRLAAPCMPLLAAVVVFDVVTRRLGVPKPFGLNATQIQESEYWIHTFLFSASIAGVYVRDGHVRIDVLRARLSERARVLIEAIGCGLFLLPFSAICLWFQTSYTRASFLEGEASGSVIGLTNIWIVKSFLAAMFLLLLAASVSRLIASLSRLADLSAARRLGVDPSASDES